MREACNDRGLNCQLPETQVQQTRMAIATELSHQSSDVPEAIGLFRPLCRRPVQGGRQRSQHTGQTAIRKDYFETIQWLKHNCNHELASGSLVVYVASAPVVHSSKMKNLAHKCALLTPWQQGCTIPTPEAGEGWNLSEQCRKAMPLDPKSFAAQYDIRTPASFDPTIGAGNPRNHMLVNLDADNILPDDCWDNLITSLSKR